MAGCRQRYYSWRPIEALHRVSKCSVRFVPGCSATRRTPGVCAPLHSRHRAVGGEVRGVQQHRGAETDSVSARPRQRRLRADPRGPRARRGARCSVTSLRAAVERPAFRRCPRPGRLRAGRPLASGAIARRCPSQERRVRWGGISIPRARLRRIRCAAGSTARARGTTRTRSRGVRALGREHRRRRSVDAKLLVRLTRERVGALAGWRHHVGNHRTRPSGAPARPLCGAYVLVPIAVRMRWVSA